MSSGLPLPTLRDAVRLGDEPQVGPADQVDLQRPDLRLRAPRCRCCPPARRWRSARTGCRRCSMFGAAGDLHQRWSTPSTARGRRTVRTGRPARSTRSRSARPAGRCRSSCTPSSPAARGVPRRGGRPTAGRTSTGSAGRPCSSSGATLSFGLASEQFTRRPPEPVALIGPVGHDVPALEGERARRSTGRTCRSRSTSCRRARRCRRSASSSVPDVVQRVNDARAAGARRCRPSRRPSCRCSAVGGARAAVGDLAVVPPVHRRAAHARRGRHRRGGDQPGAVGAGGVAVGQRPHVHLVGGDAPLAVDVEHDLVRVRCSPSRRSRWRCSPARRRRCAP